MDAEFEPHQEIDETLVAKAKYHRGRAVPQTWLFGGIECFMVKVPDCSTQTLETAIQRYILPGSHVISDGWAAYPGINQLNG
eukprot:TCALIF_13442-PA protein Name:"Protein of unknown function" AED:0.31 eAED:0.31 QI:0/0/0/0.66/0/0/3/0/81